MSRARAEAIVRAILSLADASLRVAYLSNMLRVEPIAESAAALDVICARAEQAEENPREALIAIVDALHAAGMEEVLRALREEVAGEALLALGRLIRAAADARDAKDANAREHVPDYGRGRPLTLGERKALARRPDREMMQRLLADPHPDVIARLLRSPKIVEDDVIKLAAKRPARPEVLREIARTPKWMHRGRVRMALALNPSTPPEIGSGIAGLLVRQELELVAGSTQVSAALRALCVEHLERRPPSPRARVTEPLQ